MNDLWLGPLPLCVPCKGDRHSGCLDFQWLPAYGLMACGCEDLVHEFNDVIGGAA